MSSAGQCPRTPAVGARKARPNSGLLLRVPLRGHPSPPCLDPNGAWLDRRQRGCALDLRLRPCTIVGAPMSDAGLASVRAVAVCPRGSMRVSELAAVEGALARLTGDNLERTRNKKAATRAERGGLFTGWAYSPAARRRLVRRGVAVFFLLIGTTPTSAAGSSSDGTAGTARGCL
jgi:hypothetical protein